MLLLLLALTPLGVCAQTQQSTKTERRSAMTDSVYRLTEVVVRSNQMLGSKFEVRNRTGAAYYISPEELGKFGYTDINRMLKSVPGVNVYEEDGFGLRPNISLRGTKAERSEAVSHSWRTECWLLRRLMPLPRPIISPMPGACMPSRC